MQGMRTAGSAKSTALRGLRRNRIRDSQVVRCRAHACELSRKGMPQVAKRKCITSRNDVIFAFQPHFPGVAGARLAFAGNVVVIGNDLGPDEAALEVGVNDARRLWGLGALRDGPGARFLGPTVK